MRILAFDTSNRTMSVALAEDHGILAEKTVNVKRNHSIQLMPAIEELLEEVGLGIKEIDRVSVAKGPGSYTGLRIAVTIAKTLAWTANCELTGVSSLQVLAMNANAARGQLIAPLFNARRENIYTGLYRIQGDRTVKNIERDTHIHSEEWANFLKSFDEPIIFMGQDVPQFEETLRSVLMDKFIYFSNFNQLPQASALAKLSLSKSPVDVHTFTPEYLKLTEAEANWKADHPDEERGNLVEKI